MDEYGPMMADKVISWLEAGEHLVAEQAPLLCAEIVVAHRAEAGLLVAALALLTITIWVTSYMARNLKEDKTPVGLIGGLVISVVATVGFFRVLASHIQCFVAPRLCVIETLKDLL